MLGQPRPAFGLVPWFAFLRRALTFFLFVFFDIAGRRYAVGWVPVQAMSSSAPHVLTMRSGSMPWATALSHP